MPKWTPNDAQRRVIKQLRDEANQPFPGDSKPNVAKFARTYTIYSESTLSKILAAIDDERDRSYFDALANDAARDALIESLEDFLKKLPRLRLEKENSKKVKVHQLSAIDAVAKAVIGCKHKTTPERLIYLLGPTGSGKTMSSKALQYRLAGEIPFAAVESRDAWRPAGSEERKKCKRVVLMDLCRASGIRFTEDHRNMGAAELEDMLIEFYVPAPRVLFIDEGEFFSAYALNLIKLLLNKSRIIIVLACTPRAHGKWHNYYPDEADQIDRRTDAVVSLADIEPEDAALFFPPKQFAQDKPSLEFIAETASKFGHLSLVQRVAELLVKKSGAEKADVEKAVDSALRQMGRQRTTERGAK